MGAITNGSSFSPLMPLSLPELIPAVGASFTWVRRLLKPFGGFCAESAGALTVSGTALAGIPVITTHTITGAIVGVGAVHRLLAVRWGVARRIVWAWILTIPASAAVAGLVFWFVRLLYPGA
jgi:phosphate/sulfate permease